MVAYPETQLLVGGRYRLLEQVGAGGMATVHRARDERLGRYVAVKLVAPRYAQDEPFVRMFRREAELGARLWHPNIVALLDAGAEPRDFLVMELLDGLDAGSLLRSQGRLTPDETVRIVAQVCDALAYAHDQGVLHCDVSLPNVLMSAEGTVKLADFGIACRRGEAPVARASDVAGTPGYVAPEVLAGAPPTPQSDLYSLGVVTYRLLTGPARTRPVDAATTALATAAPRLPPLPHARPDLPRSLSQAVQKAMAATPGARQRSVAEFRHHLLRSQERVKARAVRVKNAYGFPSAALAATRT